MAENYFDGDVARSYDALESDMFDPAVLDPAVEFIVDLAGDGAALEFGIGTGRIALPLANRGVQVHGIDLSDAMVASLRAKPSGEQIGVTIGDFTTTAVEGTFSVVYLVFNTIMNLTTADEQIACFQNAAAHLEPGGRFVIEVGVPQLQRLPPGETVRAFSVGPTRLGFDEYNIASQQLISQAEAGLVDVDDLLADHATVGRREAPGVLIKSGVENATGEQSPVHRTEVSNSGPHVCSGRELTTISMWIETIFLLTSSEANVEKYLWAYRTILLSSTKRPSLSGPGWRTAGRSGFLVRRRSSVGRPGASARASGPGRAGVAFPSLTDKPLADL